MRRSLVALLAALLPPPPWIQVLPLRAALPTPSSPTSSPMRTRMSSPPGAQRVLPLLLRRKLLEVLLPPLPMLIALVVPPLALKLRGVELLRHRLPSVLLTAPVELLLPVARRPLGRGAIFRSGLSSQLPLPGVSLLPLPVAFPLKLQPRLSALSVAHL